MDKKEIDAFISEIDSLEKTIEYIHKDHVDINKFLPLWLTPSVKKSGGVAGSAWETVSNDIRIDPTGITLISDHKLDVYGNGTKHTVKLNFNVISKALLKDGELFQRLITQYSGHLLAMKASAEIKLDQKKEKLKSLL